MHTSGVNLCCVDIHERVRIVYVVGVCGCVCMCVVGDLIYYSQSCIQILAEEFEDEWREAKVVLDNPPPAAAEPNATPNGQSDSPPAYTESGGDAVESGDSTMSVESLAVSIADNMVTQQAQAAVNFVRVSLLTWGLLSLPVGVWGSMGEGLC